MKKIILTAVVLSGVLSTYAQTNSNNESANAAANKNSIIIDGKKFPMTVSEYGAQQQAVKPQVVQENNKGTLGTQKPTVIAATTKTEAKQPAVNSTNTGLTIPASVEQTKPTETGSLGSVVQMKAEPAPAVKTVKTEEVAVESKSNLSNLTVMPVGSEAIAPAVIQPAVKTVLPEVKADGPVGPVKMEEVPASVVNPEVKKPEVKMQGTKGQQ